MDRIKVIAEIREHIAEDGLPAALKKLRALLEDSPLLDDALLQEGRFRSIRKAVELGIVSKEEATLTQNQIRFGLIGLLREVEEEGKVSLPAGLAKGLLTPDVPWEKSLAGALQKQGLSVSNQPQKIFQHYGWLIADFLRKMKTDEGKAQTLRSLSFMAEAWQSSLRYLCYIQLAQLLKAEAKPQHPLLSEFFAMTAAPGVEARFDYLDLLLVCTDLVPREACFTPEIADFVEELSDEQQELNGVALFLEKHRRRLLNNCMEEGGQLPQLLEEYLTSLVFWLRRLSFLARYRLVSIKNINLDYRLGSFKNFVHVYAELHSMYSKSFSVSEDYDTKIVRGVFTYNQSVLLFKGTDVSTCLEKIDDPETYLSLSPLVIDRSVFEEKPTQTPEIYYYTGYDPEGRQYAFAQYDNELDFEGRGLRPNKFKRLRAENINEPKYNELFEQLTTLFSPFNTPDS